MIRFRSAELMFTVEVSREISMRELWRENSRSMQRVADEDTGRIARKREDRAHTYHPGQGYC